MPQDLLAKQSELTDGIREIAHQIGRYDVKVKTPPGACPIEVFARISAVSVDYQQVADTSVGGTGQGNIPAGPFLLTLSASGSYEKVATTEQKYSFDIQSERTAAHTSLGVTNPVSVDLALAKSTDIVRAAIEGQVRSIIGGSHPKPCTSPQSLTLTSTTQVQKKLGGGVTVDFLVAKIGGTADTSTKTTQTVTLTVDLKGSENIFLNSL